MNWRFWRYNGRSKLTSEVPRFEYGQLGDIRPPPKFRKARGKGWRFF